MARLAALRFKLGLKAKYIGLRPMVIPAKVAVFHLIRKLHETENVLVKANLIWIAKAPAHDEYSNGGRICPWDGQ
ncbi:hypothetical protein P775_03580 [Puniceibacterium antarcticum]|uniref:Uncharacterized protein n=1 Tax=Puniceibacterium antarcticum TaxID=1206336 RepID=A0A2G8RJ68_9RHOB|nr:hypothetical protein P775_03580 [Puniceibacterium antarcticum]